MTTVHVLTLLLALALVLAVACFGLGTLRGSWRVWVLGYALTALALVLAFAQLRGERRAGARPAVERQIAPEPTR